jgi:formate-dependent nitrite reductase membrane component NrfD
MVKCTAQTEWIQGRGVLLWLAFFFIEVGAGAYLFASFFHSMQTMLLGWLICACLGGGLHLLYLGRPTRFYRMFLRPQTSWISRGMIFVNVFLILGLFTIFLDIFQAPSGVFLALTDLFAFLVIIYGGFAMCCVNGIPLWNTALLPILYVVSGLWGGAGLTLAVTISQGQAQTWMSIEGWIRLLLISFIILLCTYLLTVSYGSGAAKRSVRDIVKGNGSLVFWLLVVIVGIGAPVMTMLFTLNSIPVALFYPIFLGELSGDLAVRYLILKYGYYNPIIQSNAAAEEG